MLKVLGLRLLELGCSIGDGYRSMYVYMYMVVFRSLFAQYCHLGPESRPSTATKPEMVY